MPSRVALSCFNMSLLIYDQISNWILLCGFVNITDNFWSLFSIRSEAQLNTSSRLWLNMSIWYFHQNRGNWTKMKRLHGLLLYRIIEACDDAYKCNIENETSNGSLQFERCKYKYKCQKPTNDCLDETIICAIIVFHFNSKCATNWFWLSSYVSCNCFTFKTSVQHQQQQRNTMKWIYIKNVINSNGAKSIKMPLKKLVLAKKSIVLSRMSFNWIWTLSNR